MEINVRSNVKELTRDLDAFSRKQVPFATALALTDVASKTAKVETGAIKSTFDRPTGFTLRAMGVQAAKKSDLKASLFVKDVQAHYLEPYLKAGGGKQVLNANRAILMPIDVATNQFGNIPRNKLASLKGDPNVFIGPVKLHGKTIFGVWRRAPKGTRKAGRRGSKGGMNIIDGAATSLTLLIRFTAPAPVKPNLRYEARAEAFINRQLPLSLDAAMTKALATAR